MRANETHLIETIVDLRRKLTPLCQSVEIQTEDSGMIEIRHMRDETISVHK